MTRVTNVQGVCFGTSAFDESVSFYGGPWGLTPVDVTADHAYFRAAGTDAYVVGLVPADEAGFDRVVLEVGSRGELDAAASDLSDRGVELLEEPTALTTPGGGYGFRFRDPDGNMLQLVSDVSPAEPLDPENVPVKIAHAAYNSPNLVEMSDFYTGVLGFRVTDEYEKHLAVFLSCGVDHHRIVIVAGERPSAQHVAFELVDLEHVMKGWGRMRKADEELIWGPGRHGPGGNAFCYFSDPVGIVVEYTTKTFQIPDYDKWTPQVWERTELNANAWGTGGPSPKAIALMSGKR